MIPNPNTRRIAAVVCTLAAVTLARSPTRAWSQPPQPSGGGAATPQQVAELRARPCPSGMTATTNEEIRKMGMAPEQFWASAVTMDQMRHSPEYRAQFDAALAQARMQVSTSGGDLANLDRTAAAMRDDPALTLRCHPKGVSQVQGMGVAAGAGAGMPAMPGIGGVPGLQAGADMMQATLTQSLTSSMQKLGPAGILAGAAAPIALPLASKALGGLFNKKPKTPEQLAKDLEKNGELAIDGVKFAEGEANPTGGDLEARLSAAGSALGALDGVFLLYVQPEAGKDEEPDLKLAQQRLEQVQAMLLAAGVAGDRLEAISERPAYAKFPATAKPGNARVYLVRKRPAGGEPPSRPNPN
ncbi:MAG: hypothetical protein ACT4PM_02670 [Gemmatimonadales bacterium]